jgi:hypothetical protein
MADAKTTSEYEVLMKARETAVKNAADLLQAIAETKRRVRPIAEPTRDVPENGEEAREPGKPGSDFLYDLMQLNMAYANRLSTLQNDYRDIAKRALERWYSNMTRNLGIPAAAELTLKFSAGPNPRKAVTLTEHFAIENRLKPKLDVVVSCGPLQGPRPSKPVAGKVKLYTFKGRRAGVVKDGKVTLEHQLEFNQPQLITLEVTVDRDLPAARYTTEVQVRMDGSVRRMPVLVDLTERKKV